MGTGNFSDDFKRDAVAQITERGYPVAEVSKRLGGWRPCSHPVSLADLRVCFPFLAYSREQAVSENCTPPAGEYRI